MSDLKITNRFTLIEIQDVAKAVGMDYMTASDLNKIAIILEVATRREQERCALVAEGFPRNRAWVPDSLYDTLRRETAADIRKQPKIVNESQLVRDLLQGSGTNEPNGITGNTKK